MLAKDTQIFASFHPSDESLVSSVLEQIQSAGWQNIVIAAQPDQIDVLASIQQSGMVLIFLSKAFVQDECLMLEQFAYAATVVRKSFIPMWLDSLSTIQQEYQNKQHDQQLLSALEMLTAKHIGTTSENIVTALEQFVLDETPYAPSTPQVCEKPSEAYEGNEPYIFLSYAHDDAARVYPTIKELYESGWDLWYDEGIKITERYLPVIAHHLKQCKVFVLMLTNRCLERPFVMNYELEYARQRGIPIIPVLLEELNPQPWAQQNVKKLLPTAIMPDILLNRISATGLPNKGKRTAVPPAIRQNMVYDVALPLELSGFKFSVRGEEITLTRYIGNDTEIVIPGTVTSLDGSVTLRVTAIGDYTFAGGGLLSGFFMPGNIKENNKSALKRCKLLTSITIPDSIVSIGNGAFSGCKSLKSITIPASVTNIGNEAFFGCKSLRSITIPESVTDIGGWAFFGCKSLSSIVIPNGITNIYDFTFLGCKSLTNVTIPDTVITIGAHVFRWCKSLKNITVPDSVINIDDTAFKNTPVKITISKKSSVDAPKKTEIKEANINNEPAAEKIIRETPRQSIIPMCQETPRAKVCCSELDMGHVSALLTELYWEGFNFFLNESADVHEIEESRCVLAFISNRTAESTLAMDILKSAVQHDVSSIIQVFIGDCTNLPDEVRDKLHDRQAIIQKNLSEQEFAGKIRDSLRQFDCSLGHPRGFEIKNLGNAAKIVKFFSDDFPHVVIPKTFLNPPLPVTVIGEGAFLECKSITSVVIPDGVTDILDTAFFDCRFLKSVNIPESVVNIGENVFGECRVLNNISIPDNVKNIGAGTFSSCISLSSIIIPKNIKKIHANLFSGCESLKAVTIQDGVTDIGAFAFARCKSLMSIVMANSVKNIGSNAFSLCESLISVVIPHSAACIDESAFCHCELLTVYTPCGGKVWQYAQKNNIKCKPLEDSAGGQVSSEDLYIVGLNFQKGNGVKRSMKKANYWYTKAAKQDHAGAQFILGLNYANGKGVSVDLESARYWLTKAAENGREDAKAELAKLDAE